jgi:uncharacterized protein
LFFQEPFFLDKKGAISILTAFFNRVCRMELQVSEIKEHGVDLKIEEPAAAFPVLAELERDGSCRFISAVAVTLRAYTVGGLVELEGHVTVKVEMPCGRCLATSHYDIEADFAQTYVDELPDVTGEDGEELELSAEEMGLQLFEGETLDLNDEIQQQVVLLLPTHPLCSEECKGLCPDCGVDLNKAQCKCADQAVTMHFAALKDFKVEK